MKKVIAIVFSFVLVISNISLTYATHFCAGKAIESQLMIGAQDLTCGMIMPESTCDTQNKDCESPIPSKLDSNCCENQYIELSVDDNFNGSNLVELPNMEFVVAFVHSFNNLNIFFEIASPNFLIEAPPLIKQDFQILYQVFRI